MIIKLDPEELEYLRGLVILDEPYPMDKDHWNYENLVRIWSNTLKKLESVTEA